MSIITAVENIINNISVANEKSIHNLLYELYLACTYNVKCLQIKAGICWNCICLQVNRSRANQFIIYYESYLRPLRDHVPLVIRTCVFKCIIFTLTIRTGFAE